MAGIPNCALRLKEDWFKANKNGPHREAVGDLFGPGSATFGRVVQEASRCAPERAGVRAARELRIKRENARWRRG